MALDLGWPTMRKQAPQAYTKDMLIQAFDWLQGQSESVKEMATSPETLVGLYQQARKNAGMKHKELPSFNEDAPVSSQNFVTDLKGLAKNLELFTESEPVRTTSTKREEYSWEKNLKPEQPPVVQASKPQQSSDDFKAGIYQDPRIMSIVVEVKRRFRLTSDEDALRLMVSVGYEKIQSWQ